MLRCTDLRYTIGNETLFEEMNLTLPAREHLLITGPSGCGKTSLLAMLSGMLAPSSGIVQYHDTNLYMQSEAQRDAFRAQHIGMVFQDFHLLPVLSVERNITLGTEFTTPHDLDALNTLLTTLNLDHRRHTLAKELSIGEKQRTAIARALLKRPAWLLCDEPTSALDDRNTAQLLDLLFTQAAHAGTSLIVVTHDMRVREHFHDHHHMRMGA